MATRQSTPKLKTPLTHSVNNTVASSIETHALATPITNQETNNFREEITTELITPIIEQEASTLRQAIVTAPIAPMLLPSVNGTYTDPYDPNSIRFINNKCVYTCTGLCCAFDSALAPYQTQLLLSPVNINGMLATTVEQALHMINTARTQVNVDWNASSGVTAICNKPVLASVATLGTYNSLIDKPDLAEVACSGCYCDLCGLPTIPAAQVNSDWLATEGVALICNKPVLSCVACSGDYNDLLNTPDLCLIQQQSDWNQANSNCPTYIKNKPELARVATSGLYADLLGAPSIPEQVNSDWLALSGPAYICNKPSLSEVALSGDYNDLRNIPPDTSKTYTFSFDESTHKLAITEHGLFGDTVIFNDTIDTAYSFEYEDNTLTITDNRNNTYTVNIGTDFYTKCEINDLISAITDLIPEQASSTNQLADKNFVNSSIATNTANFCGTFNNLACLCATVATPNDYAFYVHCDTCGNCVYDRYKYNASCVWVYEYTLNNSSFTAAQWAAINSGITDTAVAKITDVYNCTVKLCNADGTVLLGSFTLNQNQNTCICLDVGGGTVTGINVYCDSSCICTIDDNTALCLSNNAFNTYAQISTTTYPGACCTGTLVPSDLNGYATCSWVTGKGYTTCKGTVTQVKVGTVAYNPSSGIVTLPAYPPDLSSCAGLDCTGTLVPSDLNGYLSNDLATNIKVCDSNKTTVIDTINTLDNTYPKKAYQVNCSAAHCRYIYLGKLPVSSDVVSYASLTMYLFSYNCQITGSYPIGTIQIDVSSGASCTAFNIRGWSDIPLNSATSASTSPRLYVTKDATCGYYCLYLDDAYAFLKPKVQINQSTNFTVGDLSASSTMSGTFYWSSVSCNDIVYVNKINRFNIDTDGNICCAGFICGCDVSLVNCVFTKANNTVSTSSSHPVWRLIYDVTAWWNCAGTSSSNISARGIVGSICAYRNSGYGASSIVDIEAYTNYGRGNTTNPLNGSVLKLVYFNKGTDIVQPYIIKNVTTDGDKYYLALKQCSYSGVPIRFDGLSYHGKWLTTQVCGVDADGTLPACWEVAISGVKCSGCAYELYTITPYIDFHAGNMTCDYTHRIIACPGSSTTTYGNLQFLTNCVSYNPTTSVYTCAQGCNFYMYPNGMFQTMKGAYFGSNSADTCSLVTIDCSSPHSIRINKGSGADKGILLTTANNCLDYCSLGISIGSGNVNRGIFDYCKASETATSPSFRWLLYANADTWTSALQKFQIGSGSATESAGIIYGKGTCATCPVIRFLNNTSATDGNGYLIYSGGIGILGAGEGAGHVWCSINGSANLYGACAGLERLYLTSDGSIYFYTNTSSADSTTWKCSYIDSNGNYYGNVCGNLCGTASNSLYTDCALVSLTNKDDTRPTDANCEGFVDTCHRGAMNVFLATSSMTNNKPTNDSYITQWNWDSCCYKAQMAIPTNPAYNIQMRFKYAGTWCAWNNIGCYVGTVKNSDCFAGCTYACAKADIRSGLVTTTDLNSCGYITDIGVNVYCGTMCKCTLCKASSLCLGSNAFNSTAFTTCIGTVTILDAEKANSNVPVALCTGDASVGKSASCGINFNTCTGVLTTINYNFQRGGRSPRYIYYESCCYTGAKCTTMDIALFLKCFTMCHNLQSGEQLTVNYTWSEAMNNYVCWGTSSSLNLSGGQATVVANGSYNSALWNDACSGWYSVTVYIRTSTGLTHAFKVSKGSSTATTYTVCCNLTVAAYSSNATNATNATCFGGCTYAQAKADIRTDLVTVSDNNGSTALPVALCTGATSVGRSTVCPLTFNPATGVLKTCCICSADGKLTTCTGTVTGINVYCGTTCKCCINNTCNLCLGAMAWCNSTYIIEPTCKVINLCSSLHNYIAIYNSNTAENIKLYLKGSCSNASDTNWTATYTINIGTTCSKPHIIFEYSGACSREYNPSPYGIFYTYNTDFYFWLELCATTLSGGCTFDICMWIERNGTMINADSCDVYVQNKYTGIKNGYMCAQGYALCVPWVLDNAQCYQIAYDCCWSGLFTATCICANCRINATCCITSKCICSNYICASNMLYVPDICVQCSIWFGSTICTTCPHICYNELSFGQRDDQALINSVILSQAGLCFEYRDAYSSWTGKNILFLGKCAYDSGKACYILCPNYGATLKICADYYCSISTVTCKENISSFTDGIQILKCTDMIQYSYCNDTKHQTHVSIPADWSHCLLTGASHDGFSITDSLGITMQAVQDIIYSMTLGQKIKLWLYKKFIQPRKAKKLTDKIKQVKYAKCA